MRCRVLRPVAILDDQLEVHPTRRDITPNDEFTAFTSRSAKGSVPLRPPLMPRGDGEPTATSAAWLLIGLPRTCPNLAARAPTNNPQILFEKVDDMTFPIFTGKTATRRPIPGRCSQARADNSAGMRRRHGWLSAIDPARKETDLSSRTVHVPSYAPATAALIRPELLAGPTRTAPIPYLDESSSS